jgi:polygalacturonase|eukprot:COSAG06_NODE_1116_length_10641_cov_138.587270_5_plen_214_part_00
MASGGNACDVKKSGAVGDNSTDDTAAIQKAIDECRALHPGGAVVVLSGPATYRVTASVELGSNLTVLIDKETTLFSAKTPPAPCNDTVARSSGTTCEEVPAYTPMPVVQNPRCPTLYWAHLDTSVLCGSNLTNVAILGADQNSSVVDGGGNAWYWRWKNGLDGPRLFEVAWSTNVTLAHATFQNSGGWTVHPTFCDGVLAHHIRILNPRWVGE